MSEGNKFLRPIKKLAAIPNMFKHREVKSASDTPVAKLQAMLAVVREEELKFRHRAPDVTLLDEDPNADNLYQRNAAVQERVRTLQEVRAFFENETPLATRIDALLVSARAEEKSLEVHGLGTYALGEAEDSDNLYREGVAVRTRANTLKEVLALVEGKS